MKRVLLIVTLAVSLAAAYGVVAWGQSPVGDEVHVSGANAWIVGGYGHNFVYDGNGYTPTRGFVTIDVNNKTNEGILVAEWDVKNWKYDASQPAATGTMKVIWTNFFAPGGVRFMNGGIAHNLFLHGDSGQEAPVLPKVFTYTAGWGLADVYLAGQKIYSDVVAHYMVTDGTRDPIDHSVHTADGKGFFNPMKPGDGFTYPERVLTHVVVHTDERDTENFPPFTMFMHVNFENTTISTVTKN